MGKLQKELENLKASAKRDIESIQISISTFGLDYSNPNRITDTIDEYEQAYQQTNNVEILFKYALFLGENNQFIPAIEKFLLALGHYKLLAKFNPQVYLPRVADILVPWGFYKMITTN
ncbi:MAG: hypothetical protein H7230_01655 [Candidatus Parcubacteria bacterium]|nr:hypothetical protein [Candidatus Paceibacterota bacterium]